MDPQQRLLLEVVLGGARARRAARPTALRGSRTGVFVGITSSDYAQLQLRLTDPARLDVYSATGTPTTSRPAASPTLSACTARAWPIDTACSSSLVAIHLACQSLRAGESDLALAGGVNLILSPDGAIVCLEVRHAGAGRPLQDVRRRGRRLRARRGLRRRRAQAALRRAAPTAIRSSP